MRKTFIWVLCLLLFMLGCKSAPAPNPNEVPLETAIREAASLMETRLESGSKVALINFTSPSQTFSEYVLDELSSVLVNSGVLVVVDRASLDKVRQELNFNMSGEVSDESAQEIGKMLGAQAIVTGSLTSMGDLRRVMFKAIITETAAIAVQHPADIINDSRVQALLENGSGLQTLTYSAQGSGTTTPAVGGGQPAAQTYQVGETGPAGGLVFFDKGNNASGWRYLEAAPAETEKSIGFWVAPYTQNGGDRVLLSQTNDRTVGEGFPNSQALAEDFNKNGGGFNTAIRYCADLQVNGFDDWFVPSMDELNWLYGNLYTQGLGGLTNGWYWSSTTVNNYYRTFAKNFAANREALFSEYNQLRQSIKVRAVRRF